MNFFQSQKRAAFAAKLFTSAGFDFEAALATGDVSALSAFLDSRSAGVSALFASAGLDLSALLASGPDSLKAHLDGLTVKAEEFSTLTATLATSNEKLHAAETQATHLSGLVSHVTTALALPLAADTKPDALKTAFDAYVSKQTTLTLAKSGHPPVADIPADSAPVAKQKSDQEKWAEFAALKAKDAAAAEAYYAANLKK